MYSGHINCLFECLLYYSHRYRIALISLFLSFLFSFTGHWVFSLYWTFSTGRFSFVDKSVSLKSQRSLIQHGDRFFLVPVCLLWLWPYRGYGNKRRQTEGRWTLLSWGELIWLEWQSVPLEPGALWDTHVGDVMSLLQARWSSRSISASLDKVGLFLLGERKRCQLCRGNRKEEGVWPHFIPEQDGGFFFPWTADYGTCVYIQYTGYPP